MYKGQKHASDVAGISHDKDGVRAAGRATQLVSLRRRSVFGLLAMALFASACGSGLDEESASVRAAPAEGSIAPATGEGEANGNSGSLNVDDNPVSQQEGGVPSGGTTQVDEATPLVEGTEVQFVQFPVVAPIVFPDVSELSEVGADIQAELGQFSATGVAVASVACDAGGVKLRKEQEDGFLQIEVDEDGAGTYRDDSFPNGRIDVAVSADGSGSYRNDTFASGRIDVAVGADGSGSYRNDTFANGRIDVALDGKGSGNYRNDTYANGRVEIEAHPDGSGKFRDDTYVSGRIEFSRQTESIYSFRDDTASSGRIELEVFADGSGVYVDNTGDDAIQIAVASDGTGIYTNGQDEATFTTNLGILHPGLIQTSLVPELLADRSVPKLDRLAPLQAPCASVIRIDDSVLFDFDSDQLRSTAGPVLDNVASALKEAAKAIEVQGHTDSKGDDAYNLNLSERRASEVAAALEVRGVQSGVTSVGLGESAPIAANETESGADNPAGRQQNRRVEIIVEN